VADKAGDGGTHKMDPHPPKRDNPLHKTNKISSEAGKTLRDGRALSQKNKKTRGGHHKK
jgi:hypothetical protein